MLLLFLLTVGASGLAMLLAFLLGFRLGGESWSAEAERVHLQAAEAQRRMHDLTRSAFVAMTEAAERRQRRF